MLLLSGGGGGRLAMTHIQETDLHMCKDTYKRDLYR